MDDNLDLHRKACETKIRTCVEESLIVITERMRHMGLDAHTDVIKWFTIINQEVQRLMDDLVTESEERERAIMDDCVQLLKKAEEYCKVLRIPMEAHGQNEERNLSEEKVLLKKRLEEYEALLQKKRNELAILKKRNIAVSKVLNEEPIQIDEATIPSEKQFQHLECEIERREKLRYEREETFITTRDHIQKILKEYEIQPVTHFEQNVIETSDATFVLSANNMKLLEEYLADVLKQSKGIRDKVTELRLKVRSIWDMLTEDIKKCDEFTRNHPGSTQSTLEAFRNELHRCEEVRKANIGLFIEKMRSNLTILWDKCHFSQGERDEFRHFKDPFFNEDLLELHERELEQVQQLYEENKNMLGYLEEHERQWKKLTKLVESSNDPTRLFNRGGQLLKEEKERNAVQRKIPQIESALIDFAQAYEKMHGKHFRSFGRTIEEIIAEKHEHQEQEKKLKLSARKIKKADLTPGKSSVTMSLARSRLTPDTKSAVKRRILSPRNATTSKKTRLAAVRKRDIQKIPLIKLNDLKLDVSTQSSSKRKRIEKTRRLSDLLNRKEEEAGYNEFSVQLCRPNLRSTLLSSESEEVLATPLQTSPQPASQMRTPRTTKRTLAYKL